MSSILAEQCIGTCKPLENIICLSLLFVAATKARIKRNSEEKRDYLVNSLQFMEEGQART